MGLVGCQDKNGVCSGREEEAGVDAGELKRDGGGGGGKMVAMW